MCFGPELAFLIPLIAGGVSAVGGALDRGENEANAANVADAQNRILVGQMNRNNTFSNAARGAFNERAGNTSSSDLARTQQTLTNDRATTINSNQPEITASTFPGAAESSSLLKATMAERIGEALDGAKARAQANAKLGGYGDLFFREGLKDADAGRTIRTNVDFTNANNALTGDLQALAGAQAYRPNSGIGSILMGLGNAYGSYGGAN